MCDKTTLYIPNFTTCEGILRTTNRIIKNNKLQYNISYVQVFFIKKDNLCKTIYKTTYCHKFVDAFVIRIELLIISVPSQGTVMRIQKSLPTVD